MALFQEGDRGRRFAFVSDSTEIHVSKEQNYKEVFSNEVACKNFFLLCIASDNIGVFTVSFKRGW